MVETILNFVAPILTAILTLVGSHYLEVRKKRNEPDLSDEDFEDKIKSLLDNIREELGAARVSYWEGSNGTSTLSGYHLKKLSMMAESNNDEYEDIKSEMQMLPISTFKRTLDLLKESEDGTIYSLEDLIKDDLANLNKGYGVRSMYAIKVKTIFNKWTGILIVGFDEKAKTLDDQQIAWMKIQASRIGTAIKQKNVKQIL